MRKLNGIISLSLTLLFTVILAGCGNDDSGPSITSIRVTVSSEIAEVGETITITAKNQKSVDITDIVDFYVNDAIIDGNEFEATEAGSFSVTAKFGTVSSAPVSVTSVDVINAISLEVDKSVIKPTGQDFVTVTAKDQNGADITSAVNFYRNGDLNADGNLFSSTNIGEFSITPSLKI